MTLDMDAIEVVRWLLSFSAPLIVGLLGWVHASNMHRFSRIDASLDNLHASLEALKADQLVIARQTATDARALALRSDLELLRNAIAADVADLRARLQALEGRRPTAVR
jgi:hypothetical protein